MNCNGAGNNKELIKWLLINGHLVFLCETWCKSKQMLLEKLELDETFNKFIHKAPSEEDEDNDYDFENCLHPPGGIAWCINKNLETNIKVIFVDSRTSYVIIDNKLVVFGLYLPSNDSHIATKMKTITILENIEQLMKKFENDGMKVIIAGDLNMDLNRNNKHDKNLINYSKKWKLKSQFDMFEQEIEHTFFRGNKRSLIDNILAKENMEEVIDAEIVHTRNNCSISTHDGPYNNGDHHPVKLKCEILTDKIIKEKVKQMKTNYIWTKFNKAIYNESLRLENSLVDSRIDLLDKNDHKLMENKSFELINKLITNMRKSGEKITDVHMKSQGFKFMKEKLDEIIGNLKNEVRTAKAKWRKDGGVVNLTNFEKLQKLLKEKKKSKKEMNEYKLVNKLNDDLSKNQSKYWKKLEKLMRPKAKVDVKIEQAKDMFQELFNNPFNKSPTSDIAKEKLSIFKKMHKDTVFDYKINNEVLIKIIKSMNTNCSVGFCGIPNEMFIHGINDETIKIVKAILELYINYNINPKFFNIGLVKLLVKDGKKNLDDINNIRPITLSDPLTIIYEKLIQFELNKFHIPQNEQYGFKVNSSCAHAIYTVKELAKIQKQRHKRMIICCLDASKAFDKMNRPIMFILLENILPNSLLRSLINY